MALHERVATPSLQELGNVHFVGIGGVSMSGIAEMYAARGVRVSGSDREDSAALRRLRELGIDAKVGHDADNLVAVDTVVVNSAIGSANPELAEASRRGLHVLHRSVALAALLADKRVIAVTGSHGKTTTSAMTVAALSSLNPSYMVGSTLAATGVGSHYNAASELFVIEADESDGSFLQFDPDVVVVTNVEADHLDNWGTVEQYVAGFRTFLTLPSVTTAIVCADDEVAASLAGLAPTTVTYGTSSDSLVSLADVREAPGEIQGRVAFEGEGGPLRLSVPGVHNLRNATAAYAVARLVGVDDATARADLAAFAGTARRFQTVGTVGGVRIIDDYAHHPTEVEATLKAARGLGAARVVVVFQPHLYSRTRDFASEFASALSAADEVIVTGVYPAREEPIPGVEGHLIADQVPGSTYVPILADVATHLASVVRPGDVVFTVGAGSVTTVGPALVTLL